MSYSVNKEHWASYSIVEQMGNIGSEVGRSIRAKQMGEHEKFDSALVRAINLFDVTIAELTKQKSVKAKEVLRAKDQYLESVLSDKATQTNQQSIEKYFMQYAYASRINR